MRLRMDGILDTIYRADQVAPVNPPQTASRVSLHCRSLSAFNSNILSRVAVFTLFLLHATTVITTAETWDFAAIGDVPYEARAVEVEFPNLIEDLNHAQIRFVVHDGDIKSGASPCTDELFQKRLEQLQTLEHPLFYVPGDNEWSDCGKNTVAPMDPMERLAKLRSMFCAGTNSLGKKVLPLERQSNSGQGPYHEFSENIRWTEGGVVFAGLNVPGSDNHVGHAEYKVRNAANLAWMADTFSLATQGKYLGVVLVIQANPYFELAPTNALRRGFNDMLNALQSEVARFGKPVLLIHGDTHYFRIDKPLMHPQTHRRMEHFTRLESFGNPDSHWVRVTVDPQDPELFRFRVQIVEKNRAGK